MSPTPTNVTAEAQSIRLQIDGDIRLAAAVGAAGRFLADAAGLEAGSVARLDAAITAACRAALAQLTEAHSILAVTLTRFADRIEIAITHGGEHLPAIGLDAIAGLASSSLDSADTQVFAGVDRLEYESQGPVTVTKLTKYTAP